MLLRVSVLVVGLVLLIAAPASAASTLTYTTDRGTLAIAANDPGLSLSISEYTETGCTLCDDRLDLRSPHGFTEPAPTGRCTLPAGTPGSSSAGPSPTR